MKKIAVILIVILLFCSCNSNRTPENIIQINPLVESSGNEDVQARLYFGYKNDQFLSGESKKITVPTNGRIETSVINGLIEGPLAISGELTPLISKDTRVINVSSRGENIFITLSKEFLSYPDVSRLEEKPAEYQNAMNLRKLAVYSIVNSIIELGQYSQVQILIDYDETGRGQPVYKHEVGMSDDKNTILGPLSYNSEIVLNPGNTVYRVLNAYSKKDFEQLYDFIARVDSMGNRPDKDEFLLQMTSFDVGIETFEISEVIVSPNGLSAIVMVTYKYRSKDTDPFTKSNVPIKLNQENNVWKVTFYSISKLSDLT